jgi:hypothetical protein
MRSIFKTTVACLAISLALPAIGHGRQIVGYIVQPGGGTQPVYVDSQAAGSASDGDFSYGGPDGQSQEVYDAPSHAAAPAMFHVQPRSRPMAQQPGMYAVPAEYQAQQPGRPNSSRNSANRLASMDDPSHQDGPPSPPGSIPSVSSGNSANSGSGSGNGNGGNGDNWSNFNQNSCNCDQCSSNCNDCEGCNSWCKHNRCCCEDPLEQRTSVYIDYLYLQAFGVDMNHGIQQNGVGGLGTVPAGDVGTAAPEFESAFRVGVHRASTCSTGWTVAYTQYESHVGNFLPAASGVGGTTQSLVLIPTTLTAANTFDSLTASYDIDFRLADFDYDMMIACSDNSILNFCVGARYAHLTQDFSQLGVFSGATGEVLTTTGILFDGGGLRVGLDGQWQCCHSRWGLYGRSFLNVLFGQFDSNYTQFNVTQDFTEARQSNWHDHRVVPILEYETGLQWTSCGGCLRLSAGYYAAHWFDIVDTAEWIQAVQHADFTSPDHSVSFCGLTSRVEYRF